jgi:hypothetical protein
MSVLTNEYVYKEAYKWDYVYIYNSTVIATYVALYCLLVEDGNILWYVGMYSFVHCVYKVYTEIVNIIITPIRIVVLLLHVCHDNKFWITNIPQESDHR